MSTVVDDRAAAEPPAAEPPAAATCDAEAVQVFSEASDVHGIRGTVVS